MKKYCYMKTYKLCWNEEQRLRKTLKITLTSLNKNLPLVKKILANSIVPHTPFGEICDTSKSWLVGKSWLPNLFCEISYISSSVTCGVELWNQSFLDMI